jgi:hypothetical protein
MDACDQERSTAGIFWILNAMLGSLLIILPVLSWKRNQGRLREANPPYAAAADGGALVYVPMASLAPSA